jgi:NhaC family Na+:H+ antiporter
MQPGAIREIGGGSNYVESSYMAVVNAMKGSIEIATDFEPAKKLMQAKGMGGMMNTVWLIICAMCFGGVMEATGLLQRITRPLVSVAKSTASLVATTTGSCLFLNLTASDQYLAIVVPGRMFQKTYQDRGLAPENLSRTLEDAGTVTSVLVPWNTCGAAQSTVLGVATLSYLPFCFFNILSPLMTMLIAMIGLKIAKLKEGNPDNDDHVAEATGR